MTPDPPPRIVRHRIARFTGFLPPAEAARLLDRSLALESRFVPSFTSDGSDDYRRSLVLDPPPDLQQAMVDRIRARMGDVARALGIEPFAVGRIECQVTANNDGAYFRVHTDAGDNETRDRVLTYVYYYSREPRPFEGGELRVYDDLLRNGRLARHDTFQTIVPEPNSIVFFHARVMHEVTEVRVPSRAFGDSRFTVNGWVRHA